MSDPRQIDCYIGLKTGHANSKSVSELAISLVATEEPTPRRALEIAGSPLDEVTQILTSQLVRTCVLPYGKEFRQALRKAVLTEANCLADASVEQAAATARRIELLFQLLPDYEFDETSIPIVEFPYPPSRVASPNELKNYLDEHIDHVLKVQNP